jgi:TPR repeat protein
MRTSRLVTGLALVALAACQTRPPLPDYATLAQAADAGTEVSAADLRDAFLASPEYAERVDKLVLLEEQATQQMVDEPLRLGGTGSAILDTYFASLTGHQALVRFYEHLGETDSARAHQKWADRIRAAIEAGATGKSDAPYRVVSAMEAYAYLRERELSALGAIYYSMPSAPFMLSVSARAPEGRLESYYFDLTRAYEAERDALPEDERDAFSPGTMIGALAHRDDNAAQASIGAYLMAQERHQDAVNWLRAATRTGNVIANVMLARLYQLEARGRDGAARETALDYALEQYLHAVALGSDEAMFLLGGLYLDGVYGEDNVPSGIALLRQAADLGNTDAMLWLAHLHAEGSKVEQSDDLAAEYFTRAAALGDVRARLAYARFVFDRAEHRLYDRRARDWLEEEAKAGDSEAMVLLGNLYARGVGVHQSHRTALDWYKRAVKNASDDANIVNEVAWTLTVSHFEPLRQPRYALEIMERVMAQDDDARSNPAYLDTWAAAYAANGQFERAVATQKDAIAAAEAQGDTEVLDVLREHLEAFESGRVIIDPVP